MMYVIKLLVSALLWTAISATVDWNAQWINNNSPFVNGTEIEPLPNATYLNTVCPNGSGTLKIQCRDNRGEPFYGMQNKTASHYLASCNVHTGIICKPWVGYNDSCPDFEINFGCDVPKTTSGNNGPGKVTSVSTSPSTTKGSGSIGQGQIGNTTSGPGDHVGGPSNEATPVTDDPLGSKNKNGRKGNSGSKAVYSRWLIALVVVYGLCKISV